MASDSVDYATVIADLKAKITALQTMVASMEAAWASGALGTGSGSLPDGVGLVYGTSGAPFELPVGALSGKSLPDAIKLYLDSKKKKQSNEQIVAALKEAEYQTSAASLNKAVSTALFRLKASKEVLRFPDGWGLASNYPETFRARFTEQVAKTPKKKSKKRTNTKGAKKVAPKPKAPPTKAQSPNTPQSPKPPEPKIPEAAKGMEQRAREIILGSPTRTFQAAEVSKLMDTKIQTIALLLGKMAHKGTIHRVGTGYQATKQASH
jgi:hypothetical protein